MARKGSRMSFNYASEKRKFDAMWAKLRVEYREAGMEESAIAAMYEFDCEVFRKNRTYGIHNTYFSTVMPDGEEVADDRSSFMKKFCNIVTENGVKGKFSIVPAPAALGDVANGIEGFPKETTDEWINMAKETLSVNFSFGPEMLTHAHVIDIETREDLGEYEHRWSQKQNKEVLIPYISKAFSLLKEAGINATGVTSPWDFGEQILEDYEEAVSVSMKNVYGRNECWYFLHMHFDTPNAKPWLAVNKEGRKLVSVPGTINDFFWPTIDNTDTSDEYINSIADKYITEDGKSGKIIDSEVL